MPTIDRFVPVSAAKNRLLNLARRVQRDADVIALTRNGVPAAILLSREVRGAAGDPGDPE